MTGTTPCPICERPGHAVVISAPNLPRPAASAMLRRHLGDMDRWLVLGGPPPDYCAQLRDGRARLWVHSSPRMAPPS